MINQLTWISVNASRICQKSSLTNKICCLPCPVTDWIYPDSKSLSSIPVQSSHVLVDFDNIALATNYISLGSFICCLFLLLSFIVLNKTKTSRHYLTIGLVTGVGLLSLSFMVPIWTKPNECFDPITANDMYSNLACAWSGALVVFGGLASVMWIFNRSLSLHLQICWQITMGKKFFYVTHALAWGVTTLLGGISLGLSGVSYRFGKVCHINHNASLGTFWGPILGFAALAAVLQFITLGYCMKVYLKNLWDPNTTSGASSSMPSTTLPSFTGGSSIRTKSAKATYRRVRKVIALQWRGVVVVMILLVSAIYFAVIFQIFDNLSQQSILSPSKTEAWVFCMATNGGNKIPCLGLAGELSLSESIVLAVLFLLSLMGFWCLLFLGRISMFTGWWQIIRRPFSTHDQFISYDARRIRYSDPRNYEMLTSPPQSYHLTKGPQGGLIATTKPPDFDEMNPSANSFPLGVLPTKEFSPISGTDDSPVDTFQTPLSSSTKFDANTRIQSFSRPYSPARNSGQGRVTFSHDGPTEIPSPHEEWPTFINRPQPAVTLSSRHDMSGLAIDHMDMSSERNLYQQRNASALSQDSTTQLRSGSALSNNGRSTPALGREWPIPGMIGPSRIIASPTAPAPLKSNSRGGALG